MNLARALGCEAAVPPDILHFFRVHMQIIAQSFPHTAYHQFTGPPPPNRPRLGSKNGHMADFDSRLLKDLAAHSLFYGFTLPQKGSSLPGMPLRDDRTAISV